MARKITERFATEDDLRTRLKPCIYFPINAKDLGKTSPKNAGGQISTDRKHPIQPVTPPKLDDDETQLLSSMLSEGNAPIEKYQKALKSRLKRHENM